jgi:hypothetical protein
MPRKEYKFRHNCRRETPNRAHFESAEILSAYHFLAGKIGGQLSRVARMAHFARLKPFIFKKPD